jgi:nucleoside-diphosphate-sugar epimerase
MEKILVLGATGFLGRNFVANYVDLKDVELTCVTRHNTVNTEKSQDINWIKGDITNQYFIEELIDSSWDQIINFYWEGLPLRNNFMNQLNLKATKKLIDLISKHSILLNNIGSGLEFNPSNNKIDDNSQDFANDDFAAVKQEIHRYLSNSEIEFRWIRPFYTYGLWQNSKSLLASIVIAHKNKTKIDFINANLAHDFISAYDFSQALIRIVQSTERQGAFNIGSGILTSVQSFADATLSALSGIEIDLRDSSSVKGICSSNLKMSKYFDWTPKYIGAKGIYSYVLNNRKELLDCFNTQSS